MKIFQNFLERNKFREAITYRETAPHEYIVKGKLSETDQFIFVEFVKFIRKAGYPKKWYSKEFIYYEMDGWKYWTMGDTIENTIILNREKI